MLALYFRYIPCQKKKKARWFIFLAKFKTCERPMLRVSERGHSDNCHCVYLSDLPHPLWTNSATALCTLNLYLIGPKKPLLFELHSSNLETTDHRFICYKMVCHQALKYLVSEDTAEAAAVQLWHLVGGKEKMHSCWTESSNTMPICMKCLFFTWLKFMSVNS